MTIYLYIKQHAITGLKYFGRTKSKNPFKYQGSGTYWKNHCNLYGKEDIITLDVYGFDEQQECTEFALKFSKIHNIVDSSNWANQIIEDGVCRGNGSHWKGKKLPDSHRENISKALLGKPKTKEHVEKSAKSRSGAKRTPQQIENIKIARAKQVRPSHSQEAKNKISDALKRSTYKPKWTAESRQKLSNTMKSRPVTWGDKISKAKKNVVPKQTICPHCLKLGSVSTMKRWHFDKCPTLT